MGIKKKRRVAIRIDMTPMVDIAFLLLIFYMATTTFKPPEARAVELPESHSQIELPDKDIINITITKEDSIYVDLLLKQAVDIDGRSQETTVRSVRMADESTIGREIERARGRNFRALIVIKADRASSFGVVDKIMKSMQELKLLRFLVITDPE